MENFHSTKNLLIDKHSSYGTRIAVTDVENAITKDRRFVAVVSDDLNCTEGDAYRKFFELLDAGMLKNKQGAVLRCDKKKLYYFDTSNSYPKGITYDVTHSQGDRICFKYKTRVYIGTQCTPGVKYRTATFDTYQFPKELTTPAERARYLYNHLDQVRTIDNVRLFEYQDSCFEKIPPVSVELKFKYPKGIDILSVRGDRVRFSITLASGESMITEVNIKLLGDNIPLTMYKRVYAFYIVHAIGNNISGLPCDGGSILSGAGGYSFVSKLDALAKPAVQPVKKAEFIPAPAPASSAPADDEPKMIADPNSEEAKTLIGKRVYASNRFDMSDKVTGTLVSIDDELERPFSLGERSYSFIKIAPQPKVKCYDFNNKAVRRAIHGRIFESKTGDREEIVVSFKRLNDRWVINDKITAYDLMTNYIWADDGTPCGVVDISIEE